jgi:hypothetical protein
MKQNVLLSLFALILLNSCIIKMDHNDDSYDPVEMKQVTFEVYATKNYSGPEYDNHFVKFNLGAAKIEKSPYKEVLLFEYTSAWIPFKDLPLYNQALRFEHNLGTINLNSHEMMVGYSYQVKIGETIQMRARNDFFQRGELSKVVHLSF